MKIKTIHCIIAALTLCLAAIICLCGFSLTAVYADGYSEVLSDLRKSENFNMSDYPARQDDYSLKVITLAESEDNELFVYVYQPSGESKALRASSINISLGTGDDLSYKNYKLRFINCEDCSINTSLRDLRSAFHPKGTIR